MRLINSLVFVAVATLMATSITTSTAVASLTEQQTSNENINGSAYWNVSYGTAPQQLRTNNGYLSVAGVGGAGQFFPVNGKSKYQIATCRALKSSSWSGFGVTYYDAFGNEVHVVRKEITADIRNGDGESRYAIGIVFPESAVLAYLWVWNNDGAGYVQLDDFRVVNYFPDGNAAFDGSQPAGSQYTQTFPADRNLILNGDFETTDFEGDEFWNVVEIDNSVYPRTSYTLGQLFGLHVGSPSGVNVVYQIVPEIQANKQYSLEISAGRVGTGQVGVVGVDFYNSSWNKLGDASAEVQPWVGGKFGGPSTQVLNFSTPSGTVHLVVWTWVPATGEVYLNRLVLNEREYEPPVVELRSAADISSTFVSNSIRLRTTDNDRVDSSTRDGNDLTVIGPNGQERSVAYTDNPFYGELFVYDYTVNGSWSASDNGTWSIRYNPGEIVDISGNAAILPFPGANSQILGSFEVNITD